MMAVRLGEDELLEEKKQVELKNAHLTAEKFKLSIDLKLLADKIEHMTKNQFQFKAWADL